MAIDLALALSAIAARTLVAKLIQGARFDRNSWAEVGGQIVEALITASRAQEDGLRQLGRKIDNIALREYDQHMAAGRRYLRDLPVEWRTAQDRRELIRDARTEFVRAVAIAEMRNDLVRQVTAEVAIAGCWLWVPSLKDVRNTIGVARSLLENEVLYGATLPRAEYADVLDLAKEYGEQPANTGRPIIPRPGVAPATYGVRIAVSAHGAGEGGFVGCAGVELKLHNRKPRPAGTTTAPFPSPRHDVVTVTIRNARAEWIAVSRSPEAVIVTLPINDTLPDENRVAPSGKATYTLPPPAYVGKVSTKSPQDPTIGFVLPSFPFALTDTSLFRR